MKIAVIGSNGFIGGHLVEELLKQTGIELKLFGRSATSKHQNYTIFEPKDPESIQKNFHEIDYIFYLASETIPSNSWNNPMVEIQNNLIPFIHFLDTVSKLGVKKIGYLSSAGTVYGLSEEKLTENSSANPFSPYGIIKLTMENYLNYYFHKSGLRYDIFRISNVYGEGQDTSKGLGLINTLLEKATTSGKIQVFGDGNNVRNFIYVKDVAHILTRISLIKKDTNHLLNIASNDSLSLNQIVDLMKKECTDNFSVERLEARGSDNKKTWIDNSQLMTLLPELKFTPIETGIKQTYSFIVNSLKNKLSK